MNVSNVTIPGDVSLSVNFLEASARAIAIKKTWIQNILCVTESTRGPDIFSACSNAVFPGPFFYPTISFLYKYRSKCEWLDILGESTIEDPASACTSRMTQIAWKESHSRVGNLGLLRSRETSICLKRAACSWDLDEMAMTFGIGLRSGGTNSTRAAMLFQTFSE